jgi:predicted TIM-barrel fold metal-dependent hydrolase
MLIDAHQHFWTLARGDYDWLTSDLPVLYRNFLPADLQPMLSDHRIDGTVAVQAAPTIAETEYLRSRRLRDWRAILDWSACARCCRISRDMTGFSMRPVPRQSTL